MFKKKEGQINVPTKGLNKDSWSGAEADYSHLQNGNFDNFDGGTFILTNEMSNILASKFKTGFRVIHVKNDIDTEDTYFFLVNPTTGEGEFGYIRSNQQTNDLEDLLSDCSECSELRELAQPLETLTQVPLQVYNTLLSDACKTNKEEGFNFNINFPIKNSVIKNEKCGKTIYFSDNRNAPRHINIDKISDYFIQEVPCDDDIANTCPDFEKMRIFKKFDIPEITPVSIELGGRLKKGVYQFLIAYCDELGNEISEYYSITNPISIFDRNDLIMEQPDLASRTNYAIRLEVKGLDRDYTHYKIAVIQTADLESVDRYYVEGIHTIDDTTVVYSTEQGKQDNISVFSLSKYTPKVEKVEGVASSNGVLFQYGVTNKKEINLQPAVNFMGQFLQWQTHIAPENLYEDGVADALYKGYNREEVVPFSIKFLLRGGYETAIFPFIGRQAKPTDLEYVVKTDTFGDLVYDEDGNLIPLDGNKDVASILANKGECSTTDRTRYWQYYNTASEASGACNNVDVETIQVKEEVTRYCTVDNVAIVPSGTTSVVNPEDYTNLADYLNEIITSGQNCSELFSPDLFCSYLTDTYPSAVCTGSPFEGLDCNVTEGNSIIEVQEVLGEVAKPKEKVFATEYLKIVPPSYCSPFLLEDGSSDIVRDEQLEDVYKRDSDFFSENCNYANEILLVQETTNNTAVANFNNYYYSTTQSDLYTTKDSTVSNASFNIKLHKNALWHIGDTQNRDSFIVDISKQKQASKKDSLYTNNQQVRVSIFKSCSAAQAIYSKIINLDAGSLWLFEKVGSDLKITDEAGTITTITGGWFSSKKYFIAVDTDIYTDNGVFINRPTSGCYSVTNRNIEYSRIDVTWTSIIISKKIELIGDCTFEEPVVKACQAIPFKKGAFAYWESGQTYPDNNELFNSSLLEIKPEDIPDSIKLSFEETFVENISGGKYQWLLDNQDKPVTDFTCRNIRHFKFPDNKTAPFIDKRQKRGFSSSAIFPLGVTIDENVINAFLDIAKNNGLISEQDRNDIVGYEILRGNLTSNRSVVASGLLYDVRKYQEKENKNKYILYPNYPFNSYSDDKLNLPFNGEDRDDLGQGAVWGKSNRNYTFHSPETDYNKIRVPSEVSVQAYMFGQAGITFDEVKEHPKYVILTQKARNLASTLATLEVVAETIIQGAQALSNFNPIAGFSNTVFPGGLVAQGLILAFKGAAGAVFNYGKYRYEWLKIFKDLGSPQNFAYYSFAEGSYNYIQTEQTLDDGVPMYNTEGNLLRGINVGKYLTEGRFTNTNEVTAEKLEINNIDRERSVFLSTGNFPIAYPTTYKTFDKDAFTSSITFSGENNIREVGRSETVLKNIASPYVYLKNYLTDQHGTINSITWIPTGYRGDLTNPSSSCISIFGGDTYICRHTLKRKHSQFLSTAMKQADLTPFNYFFYNNIGRNPKFWLSYELDKDFDSNGKLFPDIVTEKNFDVDTKGGNYYRPPSRFYLYHYGVPSFLCESRINTNFRYGGKELKEQFFPQVGDLGEWTQESVVSIREPNVFKYNSVYSKTTASLKQRVLPTSYKKEDSECKSDFPNGVIYSLPDYSENSSFDPWLIYRPNDFYEFPTSYGKLKEMRGIENQQILARFENTTAIFNAVDTTVDDGRRPETQFLGDGGIFARRPVTFSETDLGYGGTQTSASLSCEFGHFHVDSKRGQVVEIANGGKGIQEISAFTGDKPSGMRNWFKEHLPFKILKSNFKGKESLDLDNAYNGLGISMGWDSRFRRVFITKKDYIPLSPCLEYVKDEGFFFNQSQCNATPPVATCPDGYTFNSATQMCEKVEIIDATCVEDIPQYRSSWIVYNLDPSSTTSGDEIDIRNKTLLEIKCLMQVSYQGYGGAAGVYHFNPTLQVGDTLYANNILPLRVANALTGNYLIFSPYSGNVLGTPNPATDKILTINTGVITAITTYNQLQNC